MFTSVVAPTSSEHFIDARGDLFLLKGLTPTIGLLLALVPVLSPGKELGAGLSDALRADPEVEDLLITSDARERLQADFDRLSEQGLLSPGESSDFIAYLADFDQRIAEQCQALISARPELTNEPLPCPQESIQSARGIDVPETELPEDAIANLDAELAAGLGDFDEMLLREQEKVAAKAERATESGGGDGFDGDGDAGDGDPSEGRDGEQGEGGAQSRSGDSEPRRSSRGGGSIGSPRGGAPTRDDGDRASDDDVVARQLREAAEKETDPELKKKLWEEYRRYKKGG